MWGLVYLAFLFFVLTPGILLTLPKGGSKMVVAATHAVVFVVVLYFTLGFVEGMVEGMQYEDGFQASKAGGRTDLVSSIKKVFSMGR